jgi:hypothetical protein
MTEKKLDGAPVHVAKWRILPSLGTDCRSTLAQTHDYKRASKAQTGHILCIKSQGKSAFRTFARHVECH